MDSDRTELRSEAAYLAHDLRNILSGILGHAELHAERLRAAGEPAPPGAAGDRRELAESLEAIRVSAVRATAVCEDLLAYSLGRPAEHRPVELSEVVAEAVELFRTSEADVVPCALHGPTGISVLGERSQLRRAIVNLLWNGMAAMREIGLGGQIRVRWGADATGPWIEVEDEGPGLPEGGLTGDGGGASLVAETDPSSTAEPAAVHGLGLRLVAEVMKLHGGRMQARNSTGRGAVLRLEFGIEQELEFGDAVGMPA